MRTRIFRNWSKCFSRILYVCLFACCLAILVPVMKAKAAEINWPITTYSGQYKEELGEPYPYSPGAIYFFDKKDTLYVNKDKTLTLTFSNTYGNYPVYYFKSDTYAYPIGSGYGYGDGWQICTYDEAFNTVEDGNTMTFSYEGKPTTNTYVYTRAIGYDEEGNESNNLCGSRIIILTINWGDSSGEEATSEDKTLRDTTAENYGKNFKYSGYKYSIISDEAVSLVAIPKNSSGVLRLKDKVQYKGKKYKVASIGAKAFKVKNSVTHVVFGKNIVEIEPSAFSKLYYLRKVTLGQSLERIGDKAFYCCSNLHDIYVKSPNLVLIGKKAFYKADRTACFRLSSLKYAQKKAIKKLLKKKSVGYVKTWIIP
ncbi:leucine-rich repeat protein [Butyrivibrio sp. MB2005]|uniref:leucine-rich repeat protein n=1 Tax=Butyrivibrio sp. MB2005 TaxID=1280678 RepID=UPI00047D2703|nr:leucine-rich repeat protein [Butyrivibrio sp. MB2005]